MPFSAKVAEGLLAKSSRHCCLCRRFKGSKLEVHHIVQEADGGLNTEENGIVLCFDCHADVGNYNNNHPRGRKFSSSELRKHRDKWFAFVKEHPNLQGARWSQSEPDVKLLEFFHACLNRPAMRDAYLREESYDSFERAINDTIVALNTGALLNRDGVVLRRAKSIAYLKNPSWHATMQSIVAALMAIQSRYKSQARSDNPHSPEFAEWADITRQTIYRQFSELCSEAGLPPLPKY